MTDANCVPDAFMSRAEIYKQRGETALAAFSYTQAIKVKPDDAEIYFKRAKMYEKMGKILLAMEDYTKVSPMKQYKYILIYWKKNQRLQGDDNRPITIKYANITDIIYFQEY